MSPAEISTVGAIVASVIVNLPVMLVVAWRSGTFTALFRSTEKSLERGNNAFQELRSTNQSQAEHIAATAARCTALEAQVASLASEIRALRVLVEMKPRKEAAP